MSKETGASIVGFMLLTAAVFGAAITLVYQATSAKVAQTQILMEQKALYRVFGYGNPAQASADTIATAVEKQIEISEKRTDPQTGRTFDLIEAYMTEAKKDLRAYGFRFRGNGFWGPIDGILAVTPDLEQTVGIVILRQAETPGLGGRITESEFTQQFSEGVRIAPREGQIITVGFQKPEPGTPMAERHVDALTGATQTSMAMERILNSHLKAFQRAMRADGGEPATGSDSARQTARPPAGPELANREMN